MAPSKSDAKSKPPKSAAKAAPAATSAPAARATAMAAAPAAAPACPLPPRSATHVVVLDDDAQVGDRVMCENDHLLVVASLAPPQFVKA